MSKSGALILLAVFLGGCSSTKASLAVNNGFCPDGAQPSTTWPEGKPQKIEIWGSYCSQGDRTVGSAVGEVFATPPSLALYLAGYPDSSGISVALENVHDHSKLSIIPHDNPRTRWLKYEFVVPKEWVGKSVRLVAVDNATGPGGWLGFSQPIPSSAAWNFREISDLLLRTSSHFSLLFLPCFAACAYAVWKGVRDLVILGLIALASTAAPGYAVFWLWLFSPWLGHAVSFLIPLVAGAALILFLPRIGRSGRAVLRPLLIPATLVFLSSLWILSAGFAYGGMRAPFVTAWTRFSHPLPPDNMLPYLFAEGMRYGHVPSPLLGQWLSSDRPPLQTAIALSQYPYLPQPRALGHEALSVILQATWILALWILLIAFEINQHAIALVLGTILFSGFTLVNTFFVWPKLLAASYIVGFLAIVFVKRFAVQFQSNKLPWIIAGALLAFGLLAHGGSAFALIGTFFTCLVLRRRFATRAIALMMLTCITMYVPWLLYQRFYDPPGNYLLKVQLAGVAQVDEESLLQDLTTAYGKLSFPQWLDERRQNLTMLVGHEREYWQNVGTMFRLTPASGDIAKDVAANDLRVQSFFYFVPNLGMLALGPFVLLAGIRKKFRNREWRTSALLWTLVTCTLIPWCLLMFSPGSTSIHQGTYVAVLLASSGSTLALWAISRWLACFVSAVQILQTLLIYGVFMRASPTRGTLLEGTAHLGTILLFFVALVLCCFAVSRLPATTESPAHDVR